MRVLLAEGGGAVTVPLAAPAVRVDGQLAAVDFERFDLAAYGLFLRAKRLPESQIAYDWERDRYTVTTPARFAPLLGIDGEQAERASRPLSAHLFDYQAFAVGQALSAKRFALWLDTGLGKTACFLEWARQVVDRTDGKVLILSPLAVIAQTRAMARTFYGPDCDIGRLESREDLAAWCAAPGYGVRICNYEKLIPGPLPEFRHLAGLVCDESSVLKTGGGVIKWNLIHSARGIEYKLSCTATPAPNDTMEYASQASFLEKLRTDGEILWTYFVRGKDGEWHVKPHAREAFYRFMSSWSLYLRDPAHFGFGDILATLPAPELYEERLAITPMQQELAYGLVQRKGGGLFLDDRLGVVERTKLAQLARGFLYDSRKESRGAVLVDSHKPGRVAEIVRSEVAAGRQVLVWTVFDQEGEIIRELLASAPFEVGILTGSQSEERRLEVLERFRAGDLACLITKPQLAGYGLNLQFCRGMVFSGFDDSFERMYQAIRRAYRFGQTETVRVFVPYVPELEGMVYGNVRRKEERFNADVADQEQRYRQALDWALRQGAA